MRNKMLKFFVWLWAVRQDCRIQWMTDNPYLTQPAPFVCIRVYRGKFNGAFTCALTGDWSQIRRQLNFCLHHKLRAIAAAERGEAWAFQ